MRYFIPVVLAVSLVFATCSQRNEQPADQQKASSETAVTYTCPMHPEVISQNPGTCPKCGMTLVPRADTPSNSSPDSTTPSSKIKVAKRMLRQAVGEMVRDGSYKCCIEVPCLQCALDHQSCPCYSDLKKGKPVCNECYGGWQRGEGRDKSISPNDVKTTFSTHKH